MNDIPYGYCQCGCGKRTSYSMNKQLRGKRIPLRFIHNHRNKWDNFSRHFQSGEPDDCWEWQGAISKNGYGNFNSRVASRVAWEFEHGPTPSHLKVCHTCDNRRCVNTNHMFLGTQLENIHDAIRKGRKAVQRGEDKWSARLTEKQVIEIRKLAAQGMRKVDLALRYAMSPTSISNIVHRKKWRHIL